MFKLLTGYVTGKVQAQRLPPRSSSNQAPLRRPLPDTVADACPALPASAEQQMLGLLVHNRIP